MKTQSDCYKTHSSQTASMEGDTLRCWLGELRRLVARNPIPPVDMRRVLTRGALLPR